MNDEDEARVAKMSRRSFSMEIEDRPWDKWRPTSGITLRTSLNAKTPRHVLVH